MCIRDSEEDVGLLHEIHTPARFAARRRAPPQSLHIEIRRERDGPRRIEEVARAVGGRGSVSAERTPVGRQRRVDPEVGTLAEVDRAAPGIQETVGYDIVGRDQPQGCLLYTSPSPRDRTRSRMPSSA